MRLTRPLLALGLCLASFAAAADSGFDLVPVSDGIYAAIRKEVLAQDIDGNSLIIINDRDVVVVDANDSGDSARATIAAIRRLTDKPVRYVVNTHWHNDHIAGNKAYEEAFPGVDFIAHPQTRTDFAESNEKYYREGPALIAQRKAQLAKGVNRDGKPLSEDERKRLATIIPQMEEGLKGVAPGSYTLPTVLVDDELILHRGERRIEIRHLGRGNTRGDLVVYLPKEKILATGDLVVNPVPFSFGSYLGDWIQTLDRVAAFDAVKIVPGHGPVQNDKTYIAAVRELIQAMLTQIKAAVARGQNLEQARAQVDLADFRRRFAGDDPIRQRAFDLYFVAQASKRAYHEATGVIEQVEPLAE